MRLFNHWDLGHILILLKNIYDLDIHSAKHHYQVPKTLFTIVLPVYRFHPRSTATSILNDILSYEF